MGQLANVKITCSSDNSIDQCQFSDLENCTVAMCKGMSSHKEIHTKVFRSKSALCLHLILTWFRKNMWCLCVYIYTSIYIIYYTDI